MPTSFRQRATVIQQKTAGPAPCDITDPSREALALGWRYVDSAMMTGSIQARLTSEGKLTFLKAAAGNSGKAGKSNWINLNLTERARDLGRTGCLCFRPALSWPPSLGAD